MPRLKGSADLLEDRRRRALALCDTGLSLNEVGRRISCAPSSVLRWLRARRRGGPDALRVRFSLDKRKAMIYAALALVPVVLFVVMLMLARR